MHLCWCCRVEVMNSGRHSDPLLVVSTLLSEVAAVSFASLAVATLQAEKRKTLENKLARARRLSGKA